MVALYQFDKMYQIHLRSIYSQCILVYMNSKRSNTCVDFAFTTLFSLFRYTLVVVTVYCCVLWNPLGLKIENRKFSGIERIGKGFFFQSETWILYPRRREKKSPEVCSMFNNFMTFK